MTGLLIRLLVRDADEVKDPKVRQRYGMLAGMVGIFCNVMLSVLKVVLGLLSGAVSIAADAVNNLSDAASSVVTLLGFRLAGKSADKEHPYGHGRMEYISGFIVAAAVVAVAIELLRTSADHILHPVELDVRPVTIVLLSCAIVVKCWMALFYSTIGKRISSTALRASATDSLADCVTTAVALAVVVVMLLWNINIDGYAGVIVALLVMAAGVRSAKETIEPLLGQAPDKELVEEIRRIAMEHEELLGVHDLRVHEYGPGRTIASMHAEIPYTIGMLRAHEILDEIEQQIVAQGLVSEITIHTDPVVTDDLEMQQLKQMTQSAAYALDPGISVHDFRMQHGEKQDRISFDVAVPYELAISDEEISSRITTALEKIHAGAMIRVTVDREEG
ncbi:MAG: cation transporter [Lachnospiraceae bacterium]|nr:cation transporter [Lachnospiraceae bacterium]